MAVPEELAVAYVSIIPSARGIEKKLASELAPTTAVAAKQGEAAGAALGTSLAGNFSSKTGNLLQGVERQVGNFGGPQLGVLSGVGRELQLVQTSELAAASGASQFGKIATAAYIGVGVGAVALGVKSVHAFLEGQDASANYAQALHVVGASHDELEPKIDATVKKMAAWGFENDDVELSAAKLTRTTKDASKSLDLVSLAADIARGRQIDLAQATDILVKVETGHVALLGRLGINTKDAAGNTISQEEALQRLSDLYGGSASAAAKTYAGELRAVEATAHNLEEELGGKVLPVIANVGKAVLSGVHGLETINKATDGWLGTLGGAALVTGGVVIAVDKISSGVSHLTELLNVNKTATDEVAAAQAAAATTDVASIAQTPAPAQSAVREASLTIARAELATATEAVTEAQANFDAALLAGAGAEQADLTSATVLTEADATLAAAKQELAAATAEVTALTETETVANTGLGLSLAAVTGGLAAAAGGFIIGQAAGHKLNDLLVGTKPNVDELTTSLLNLSQSGDLGGIDTGKLAGDLKTIKGSTLQKGFGFAPSAHRAVADIGAENDALQSVLQTAGVDEARKAFGLLTQSLEAQGVSLQTIGSEFSPFLDKLDLAAAQERATKGTTDDLSGSFTDLAASFAKDTAKLGVADQLDAAKQAVDDLNQLKLDAAGQGDKSKQAAQQEASAQQSLTDAYRSQSTAATSLADAKSKLSQFDGPTDSRIRTLELQNIQGRVVTSPEEARQKEIDLLQFSEDNANKRADLQAQVVSAQNSVTSATEGVGRAEQQVATAAANRKKIQVDAADAIAAAERKAKEAIDAAGTAIQNAQIAGQLGKGNKQLSTYVGLLDAVARKLDPSSPLVKNLDNFLKTAALTNGQLTFAGPAGPDGPVRLGTRPPAGPQSPSTPTIDYHPTTHIDARGSGVPTTGELDTLNKKQATRLRVSGIR